MGITALFFSQKKRQTQRAKQASDEGRSPPQELEEDPRSGPFLLVFDESFMVGWDPKPDFILGYILYIGQWTGQTD